ncbi:MAG: hypothetical protein LC128_08370 [Chitinophagales bacterium]|nr:hypothetical protein [Chitinophagales bacterium]
MDLNHIELTPDLTSQLYQRSLIAEERKVESKTKKRNEEKEWIYTGQNERNILLLFDHPDKKKLTKGQEDFLNKILNACHLKQNDIVLMNRSLNAGADYKNLPEFFKCRIVLLFGIEPVSFGLPMNFPQFQIQSFSNCTFLYAPAIDELGNDKVLKSKLWSCLKRIFNI